jgi:hypothetical protein
MITGTTRLGSGVFAIAWLAMLNAAAIAQHSSTSVDVLHPSGNDDIPMIQRAIDSLSETGGAVHIRAGVYQLDVRTHALRPRRNTRLVGDGRGQTVLRVVADSHGYRSVLSPQPADADLTGFSLADLTIDQNTAANPIDSPHALTDNPRAILIAFAGSHISVERCEFTGVAGTNTLVFNGPHVTDVRVRNNAFTSVGNTVAQHFDHSTVYAHGDRVQISDNVFRGRGHNGGTPGATTAIETHGSTQIVSGNVIDGYFTGMNITGIAEASDHVIVSGNVVTHAAIGIQLWSRLYGSNRTEAALRDVLISGNTITIDRDPWAAVTGTHVPVAAGIAIDPHSNAAVDQLQIDGNTIRFQPSSEAAASDDQSEGVALWLADSAIIGRSLLISNNQISGSYGPAIRLSMSTEGAEISGNVLRNPAQSTRALPDSFRAAILVSHLHRTLAVHDNLSIDDQATPTMKYAVLGAATAGSAGLTAVANHVQVASGLVPGFQNTGTGGVFYVSYSTDTTAILPTYSVAAGSAIIQTSTSRRFEQVDGPAGTRWKSVAYGREPPRGDTWSPGDIVYNTDTASSAIVGWICVSGGTPGEFVSFGTRYR